MVEKDDRVPGVEGEELHAVDEHNELTPAGRALHATAADIPWTVLCQLPLTPEEAVSLKQVLTRLAAGLGEAAPDAAN